MGKAPDKSRSDIPQLVSSIISDYWPLLLTGVLFIALQWPVLKNWWGVWEEKEGYYSHGVLVPFIAAFMLWINRSKLARAGIEHSWFGLLLLLVFLPVHIIGLMMGLRVIYGVAFFLCLFGAALMLLGSKITRIAFIPIMFLSTMMPVASWILDSVTARFQLVSATVATKFLQLTSGHDVSQYGNTIYSPSLPGAQTLLVGSPCSGLRLLISLITFSWFFVYVIKGAWWKKAILLAMSFPLSIFINSLRITMIGYVGFWTGSSEAMHTFHDYSGYIGLVICFVILFGIAKLLKTGDLDTGEPVSSLGSMAKPWPKPVGGGVQGAIVIALFVFAAVVSNTAKPLYDLPKGHVDRDKIPLSFGSWTGSTLPIDRGTKILLDRGDLMSRMYVDPATDRQVQVFVDASLDIMAFHDPHLCLPGGGSPITEDRAITLSFTKPKPITVHATVLEASSDYGTSLLIYWYMLGGKSFPRTPDVADANRLNKKQDLVRLMTRPWDTKNLREDILSRQFVWYRFSCESYGDKGDLVFLKNFIRQFVANVENFGE
ncbi:MAG: exosortase/archaeosortase family protein [Armatimonadota bacterium]